MEYNYLLPKKKEEEEEGEMLMFSMSFLPYRKALYIVAWWRKKTSIALNKGVKQGRKSWNWRR